MNSVNESATNHVSRMSRSEVTTEARNTHNARSTGHWVNFINMQRAVGFAAMERVSSEFGANFSN